jgi:hypothetical protein
VGDGGSAPGEPSRRQPWEHPWGKRSQKEGQRRESGGLVLSLWQLGHTWKETTIRACPRLSVTTQSVRKFSRGLGRPGPHGLSVLHLVRALGAGFTQTDLSDVCFWVWVPPLEMP